MSDGGPAFPLKNYTGLVGPDTCGFTAKDSYGNSFWVNSGSPGMSLRDWFAGMALTYVGNLKMESAREGVPLAENDWSQGGIATLAYDIADAMLAESEGRDTEGTGTKTS